MIPVNRALAYLKAGPAAASQDLWAASDFAITQSNSNIIVAPAT